MTLRDWLILTFTLIVGILSGMYLYATAFKPVYIDDAPLASEEANQDFRVDGFQYGGLNANSPSFRVLGNRTYEYFPGGNTPGEKITGSLPNRLFTALTSAVENADLLVLQESTRKTDCPSFADGTDYEYTVERNGAEFALDTCTTRFENSSQLGQILLEVWRYLDAPDEYRFSISNMPMSDTEGSGTWRGLRGYFEDGFDESFESR